MLAAEQRAIARRALQEKFGDRQLNLSLERLEFLRRRALEQDVGRTLSGGTLLRAFRRRRDRLRRRPAKFLWHQSALGLRTHRAHHADGFYLQRTGPYGRDRAADYGAHPEFRQISALLRPRQHLGKQSLRSRPGLRRLRGQSRQSQRARPGARGQQAPGAGTNWRRTVSPFHKTLISSPGSMTRRPITSSSSIWKTFLRLTAKTCSSSYGALRRPAFETVRNAAPGFQRSAILSRRRERRGKSTGAAPTGAKSVRNGGCRATPPLSSGGAG